jgi:hypothetical protein
LCIPTGKTCESHGHKDVLGTWAGTGADLRPPRRPVLEAGIGTWVKARNENPKLVF